MRAVAMRIEEPEDLPLEDIQRLWAEEAVRRDVELDSGTASMRDAEDVFRDARIRLLKKEHLSQSDKRSHDGDVFFL